MLLLLQAFVETNYTVKIFWFDKNKKWICVLEIKALCLTLYYLYLCIFYICVWLKEKYFTLNYIVIFSLLQMYIFNGYYNIFFLYFLMLFFIIWYFKLYYIVVIILYLYYDVFVWFLLYLTFIIFLTQSFL